MSSQTESDDNGRVSADVEPETVQESQQSEPEEEESADDGGPDDSTVQRGAQETVGVADGSVIQGGAVEALDMVCGRHAESATQSEVNEAADEIRDAEPDNASHSEAVEHLFSHPLVLYQRAQATSPQAASSSDAPARLSDLCEHLSSLQNKFGQDLRDHHAALDNRLQNDLTGRLSTFETRLDRLEQMLGEIIAVMKTDKP